VPITDSTLLVPKHAAVIKVAQFCNILPRVHSCTLKCMAHITITILEYKFNNQYCEIILSFYHFPLFFLHNSPHLVLLVYIKNYLPIHVLLNYFLLINND